MMNKKESKQLKSDYAKPILLAFKLYNRFVQPMEVNHEKI